LAQIAKLKGPQEEILRMRKLAAEGCASTPFLKDHINKLLQDLAEKEISGSLFS
jgi:hypothetical protein